MLNLQDNNLSYVIINPIKDDCTILENNLNLERLCSVYYSKDFSIFPLKELSNESMSKTFLAIHPSTDNDSIRQETLQILEFLDIDKCILKYVGHKNPVILEKDGNEAPLVLNMYPEKTNESFFILDGLSFNFSKEQRYFYPKMKNHLKNGMLVEYFNNDIWKSKQIDNIDVEYDRMFSLLIKYDKLRIPIQ